MITLRVLTTNDIPEILAVNKSRPTMMSSAWVKLTDHSDWLNGQEGFGNEAFDPNKTRMFGLFEDDVLMIHATARIWWEMPTGMEKSYSYNLVSRKTDKPAEKDANGHPVNTIKLINFLLSEMEKLGYYNFYTINNLHRSTETAKPHYTNETCRIKDYTRTHVEEVKAGQIPSKWFFQRHLISRPYDIDLYVRNFRLSEEVR